MTARPFILGVSVGACLGAGAFLVLGGSGTPAPSRGVSDTPETKTAARAESLQSEVEQLRSQLEQANQPVTRTKNSTPEAVEATASGPAEPVEAQTTSDVADRLVQEFKDFVRLGYLRRWALAEPDNVAEHLIDRWIWAKQPNRALFLMQAMAHAPGVTVSNYGNYIGKKLLEKGDAAMATQAFLVSLQNSPGDWESVRELMALDPAAAIQVREQSEGDYESEGDRLTQDAMLKLAAGQRDEALSLIDDLLSRNELSDQAWNLLVKNDPEAAESRLRARTFDDDDAFLANQLMLLRAVKSQGRNSEARAAALALLGGDKGSPATARRIASLFPDLALKWLQNESMTQPSVAVWSNLGRLHAKASRVQDAVHAYSEAWNLNPSEGDYGRKLLNLAPAMIPQIISRAQSNRDDELIGDVADKLWQDGRQTEALTYWQQAQALDPSDSEWSNKVNAVQAGRSPM